MYNSMKIYRNILAYERHIRRGINLQINMEGLLTNNLNLSSATNIFMNVALRVRGMLIVIPIRPLCSGKGI